MKTRREGNKLTIEVELDPKGRPSSTGKSLVVYSSQGFVPIEGGDMRINLTIIKM